MNPRQKLAALRGLMTRYDVDAYFVPSTDPHQSEYVPDCWQRRRWLSGFTGSAGDLVVTLKEACLWTDGRYFLQATEELKGSGIRLLKMGESGVPKIPEFLATALGEGEVLGADPRVLSLAVAQELEAALTPRGARLALLDENLVDRIWTDRPGIPAEPVTLHLARFTGESSESKLRRLRREMKAKEAEAHLITTLDAVAWLFNLRGRDVPYNPVVIAFALVTHKSAVLFILPEKVPPTVSKKLSPQIAIRPYEAISEALRDLAARKARVWVDNETANRWVVDLLSGSDLVTAPTPVALMKARKNPSEIAGMRQAHVRDGVAMARFLHWLEQEVPSGTVTEISAATRLGEFRAEGEHFQGLSFPAISGYAEHGAIVHYQASEKTNVPLRPQGIYLIDSGGQYLDGTTDITRTVLLGKAATREQKDRFTRVLKGHIALARAKFPEGVRGLRLDTLARVPLWEAGLDYNHGTGHGVGSYLNVHEGPQSISPHRCFGAPLEAGNILSNEPGYYQPGAYGIRIESLILVRPEEGLSSTNGKAFLGFDTITMCPIDTRLLEVTLLTPEERGWLNSYHKQVFKALSPLLSREDRKWLQTACEPR